MAQGAQPHLLLDSLSKIELCTRSFFIYKGNPNSPFEGYSSLPPRFQLGVLPSKGELKVEIIEKLIMRSSTTEGNGYSVQPIAGSQTLLFLIAVRFDTLNDRIL